MNFRLPIKSQDTPSASYSNIMNQASPTFELAPATCADIPRLAYVYVVACLPDNAFALYFDNPKEFEQRVTEMFEGQVGDPNRQHIKVVDKDTGEITAWASWNTPTDVEIRERDEKAAAKILASKKDLAKGEFDFPLVCRSVFTEPTFQRRGMGNALVEYGNKLADKKGLPIFMQASPFGFPLYTKHGFETVQCSDVDLREWAPDAEGNDKGYGNYKFRYMQRLPQTLPESI
ncbi:hypothetical protein BTUL_0046g00190 [Botrytis tulipae]|uniref:N-acetyltransferase domain-containing protein n=1 Tax=Botrytis tulipae TaxID=87230 RepID=A0A4Z1F0E4_9HELO|nr:hypothetical protein BTUL_0046g00190 [Botrytis tulipae]